MVNVYLNLSIFTVFLKNRNFISKIRISKVTDYAALRDVSKNRESNDLSSMTSRSDAENMKTYAVVCI